MQTAVIGAGSWGTALAIQLGRAGQDVRVWDRDAGRARLLQESRQNARYLPGATLPDGVTVGSDVGWALDGAEVVLSVVPVQAMREVWAAAAGAVSESAIVCCASKGIEQGTGRTTEEVLKAALPDALHPRLCALAGPSFAKEVALGLPTAVVVAGRYTPAAEHVASALHGGAFRVYTTEDIVGAELGGALKNVAAIACGTVDGCGLGHNARAAVMTRGLAEIARLAGARGANPLTLSGLAGLGDLVLTCTGDLSRNRRVGLGLAKGKTLPAILEELGQVAEGVFTAKSAWELSESTGVDMPITEQVYRMLYEEKPVSEALRDLLGRQRKAERG